MGRKRRHARKTKGGSGALTRLRGGFQSTVQSATGTGKAKPTTSARRTVTNVVTIVLLVAAVALLLRRFGVLH